jgi:hypothetical protein
MQPNWRYTAARLGAIAQLGERHAGSVEVVGSSPTSSIPFPRATDEPRQPALGAFCR